MRVLRTLASIIGILGAGIALNCLILGYDPFGATVLGPLAAGAAGFLIWLILTLVQLAGSGEGLRSLSGLSSIASVAVFLGICIVLYAFVLRWDVSWDLTREGRRDLAPQTVRVLESLTDPIQVYVVFVRTGSKELTTARDKTLRFLERCQEYTSQLEIHEMDPVVDKARMAAEGFTFVNPDQGTVVMRSGSRPPRTIPLKGVNPRLEEREFTNALINVARRTQPTVGLLTGHGERGLQHPETAGIKSILENEGYVLEDVTIDIARGAMPGGIDILFINALTPQAGGEVHPKEIDVLDDFINNGGSLACFFDPQYSSDGTAQRRMLFQWLEERFGIVVGEDLIISGLQENPGGEVTLLPDAALPSLMDQYEMPDVEFDGCFNQDNPITRSFNQRLDFGPTRSVSLAGDLPSHVVGQELLHSLPLAYAEKQLHELVGENAQVNQGPDEPIESVSMAVAATVKNDAPAKDGRIVVVGNSGFARTQAIQVGGNLDLTLNIFNWISEDEDLIAIRPTGEQEQPLHLSNSDEKIIVWMSSLGAVQVVALAGFFVLIWRRRYQ